MEHSQKNQIQLQLRQFLKGFRNLNSLSAEEAAAKLNVEIATYRALEGKKASNRVLSAVEYLGNIASLNNSSLTDFIRYLERTGRTESGSNDLKRKLYEWEIELLNAFDKVGIPLRNKILKALKGLPVKERKNILTGLAAIISLPQTKKDALITLAIEMERDNE